MPECQNDVLAPLGVTPGRDDAAYLISPGRQRRPPHRCSLQLKVETSNIDKVQQRSSGTAKGRENQTKQYNPGDDIRTTVGLNIQSNHFIQLLGQPAPIIHFKVQSLVQQTKLDSHGDTFKSPSPTPNPTL